ncbi:ferritin-like domain-containing protein [Mesorhizobium sp. BAC0120]|uniref:ferritin-like domain-containing protein n=1 Tax=Mesorhizobium sp. BAC0120 TaxID=3090670 RepID=UPI00298CC1F6|nr:ferritin-like domain-containing protein [Mesorhizobium sp. BAC0120]MDW6020516.1 ferritin-like domain-containing protein [Mesorhizobium sp. BAC0120]
MENHITEEARNIFVVGLRNAHAMENQALSIMKPQVDSVENYPEVAQRLEQHVSETEGQIRRIETVLDDLGEDSSSLKDTALSAVGSLTAMGHSMAGDEILKNSFANFAFENYEIAAYRSLITLAQDAGFENSVGPLNENLAEEEAMAKWLEDNLPTVTHRYLELSEAGHIAKA